MKNDFFSQNLKFIRNSKGMTQAEIADSTGVKRSAWTNYESGLSVPNLELFKKIANLFDISTDDLLYTDLSKGNLIQKSDVRKNQEKGNLKGNLITENEPIYVIPRTTDQFLQFMRDNLRDKERLIAAKDALITRLNAELDALQRHLSKLEKVYPKLKHKVHKNP